MHPFSLPDDAMARARERRGAVHVFGRPDPTRAALIVVDMQNYFCAPGFMAEVPMARTIVPGINRLAGVVRDTGGLVVWIQTSAKRALADWPVLHDSLMTKTRRERRLAELDETHDGFKLYPALDARADDLFVTKTHYSAFISGSSELDVILRQRGIDTLLIAGTATNVCCESSARDAMMRNFKVAMIADACAAQSDALHAAALLGFYTNFGDVMTVDEAASGLTATR